MLRRVVSRAGRSADPERPERSMGPREPRRVFVVSLAPADDERVLGLVRALTGRGDAVTVFGPPAEAGGEAALTELGADRVGLGGAMSDRPRLREVLRFGAALAVQVGARRLRGTIHAVVVHGGEEAVALLGTIPRLAGARLVLDLDLERAVRAAGLAAALASVARGSALRGVAAATTSDPAGEARLRELGVDAVEVLRVAPPGTDAPRREVQPRVTVKSPVRLLAGPPWAPVTSEALEAILRAAVAAEPRLELDWAEPGPEAARALGARLGVPARPFPPDAGRARVEAVHVALVCGGGPSEVLPHLAVGIPVVAFRTELGELAEAPEPLVVRAEAPGPAGEALGALLRSSRDRRELIKRGWAWLDDRGGPGDAAPLFRAVDGSV